FIGRLILYERRIRAERIRVEAREHHAALQRRFLQRLDHELKNPLTIIQLGLANLQPSIPQEEHDSFARIEEQTQRLQRLVEGLRRLTDLEALDFERESIDLSEVLEAVVALVRDSASSRNLILNVRQIPWKLPLIWGDRDLLEVALRNLLDNAVKYTPLDGRIEVRASENGHGALIEIADTGLGIQPDDLPHVYEELYRGANTRQIAGSGLGLAMVKRIIDLHQGQIDIYSRPGEGTVITLHLPLAPAVRN
ncbi:MAG: HAMP domain-containing histidine kinase, partial [Anaerolineae bacterium]|nr:HAMP domain-containing histidine kinase [Anaerolineae bacterium]